MAKDPDDRWATGRGVRRAARRVAHAAAAPQGRAGHDRHAQARHARPHAAALAARAPGRRGRAPGARPVRAPACCWPRWPPRCWSSCSASCCSRATATTRATRRRRRARRPRRRRRRRRRARRPRPRRPRRRSPPRRRRRRRSRSRPPRPPPPAAAPSQLQLEAYNLNNAGKYDAALPVAQQAVTKGCQGDAPVNPCGYALYELGRAQLGTGDAAGAVATLSSGSSATPTTSASTVEKLLKKAQKDAEKG